MSPSLAALALVVAVGLLGPLLAWSDRMRLPVIVGELLAGVLVGQTGVGWIDPQEPTLTFLANIGFAMVMFISGCHVPIRDSTLLHGIRPALARLAAVTVVAVALGFAVAGGFHTGHGAWYAVLFASSSAAVIMPMVSSLRLSGPNLTRLIPQVAIADAACIVALPLVLEPGRAGPVALGALAVIGCSAAAFGLLWLAQRRGALPRWHDKSKDREFALELRVSVLVLLLIAALAQAVHVSIMLAGFCLGLAVAAVGPPRRLARQLFGLTEGFLGPIFFVWLGASLNLRDLVAHPQMIVLGVVLALGALAAHAVAVLLGLPLTDALFAAAQIGVPVAAVMVGSQLGILAPGEGAAVLLAALVTIGVSAITGRRLAARNTPVVEDASGSSEDATPPLPAER